MSQAQLGAICHCDGSVVSRVEGAECDPPDRFAAGCDEAFPDMFGWFSRFCVEYRLWGDGPIPRWFEDWLIAEQQATTLRIWQPLVIPGLFQTPDYARALFEAAQIDISPESLDDLVAARVARQAIFEAAEPSQVITVLDEAVLHRLVGSPLVMREQLARLAVMSERPFISVQVIPGSTGAHAGLAGSFMLASLDGKPDILHIDAVEDQLIDRSPLVRKAVVAFDRVRGDALPRAISRDLILKVAGEQWNG
ncbi:MAG TPA: DUF5753 domain-containing protein [Streptosporangiaceae bacterium]|jgi:hypothetical protein